MAASPTGPDPDPEKDADHAAAEWLFQDDPKPSERPRQPTVAPGGEAFDLADAPTPVPRKPAAPAPSSEWELAAESAYAAKAADRARPKEAAREAPERDRRKPGRLESASRVDQVWSRGSEWGPTFAVMLLWAGVALFVLWLCLASEMYTAALVVFGVGTIVGLALFYPIVITLERPVRMTPEQALRDYYTALSHHFPHYKRMWLLLGNAGRTTSQFASFEGFKRYWKGRLKQLREGRVKGSAPLVFVIAEFKSEKSGGKTEIDATWTTRIFVRGRREQGPIWSLAMGGSFVKGPDNMWYLEDGTLAERAPKKAAEAAE
ncbi:hypothetical protein [Paludisphaera soli]|uniref:hypothetical protein n=1 Tax=Paludisphaera soli TaxID=2712865 RepID=UPI0013EA6ED5|nr:hypothetical protein [Paludisphaera soli]